MSVLRLQTKAHLGRSQAGVKPDRTSSSNPFGHAKT